MSANFPGSIVPMLSDQFSNAAPFIVAACSACKGVIQDYDPPRLLSFTWAWHETGSLDTPREHETTVTLQFRPVGKRTELMLTQTRFQDGDGTKRHHWVWTGSFEKLDAFLSAAA